VIYRNLALGVVVLTMGSPIAHAAQDESPDVAMRVVKLLDSKGTVAQTFKSMLPDNGSREFADRLLLESPEIWDHLEGEVAGLVRSRFSGRQLQELEVFLSSETGRAWTAYSPEIFAAFQGTANDPESFSFRFTSIGCVVGIIGPNIEAAKEKAGVDGPGLTDELYAAFGPVKNASAITCDCILRKGLARWPSLSMMQLQLAPEYQQYAEELLQNGDCPMPFPR